MKVKNSLPEQVIPSPVYPALHFDVRLPTVLVHNAFVEHPPLLVKHSFISIFLFSLLS